jgi:hypothetical protein
VPESARAREAAETEPAAAPQRASADRRAERLRVASAVGNRRLAQLLSRAPADGYGYSYADDPLNAGGFGPSDATIRVRPGPVRATIIGERATPVQTPQLAAASAESSAAPAAAPDEPLTPIRQIIIDEINKYVGAVEGADPRFSEIFAAGPLESARIGAASDVHLSGEKKGQAKKPSVHTTCIDFQTIIWSRAWGKLEKAGAGKAKKKIVTPMNGPSLDAFVKAEPGMPATRRPKPGDFYILWSTKQGAKGVEPKSFSHVAWLTGRTVDADGSETWSSVDGGQGAAADYTPKGKLISKGAEAILACTRTYFPASNLVAGGVANQDAGGRWLLGWVDVDKLVT